jgi:iron complex outermembrane receptor protein
LVIGNGFFDYDGSWSIYYDDYFRLKENGFLPDTSIGPTNSLIRAQVENVQWGWIPRFSWQHHDGILILGAEYRNHKSKHWGSINYAENLPEGITKNYRYYYYEGGKDILNFFVNENYYLTDQLNILGEIQFAYHKYRLNNEKYLGNNFSVDNFFINPRFGINYRFNNNLSSYLSYAKVSREPRLKNYYDAAESSAGEIPQFEVDESGKYDFNKPLVKPENMNSFDLGINYSKDELSFTANAYYMLFDDEIVKKGQVDRFGQPITGNVDKTIHTGLELTLNVILMNHFDLILNGSFSKNYISSGKTYIDQGDNIIALDLSDNRIAGFPDITANGILQYYNYGFFVQFSIKYVGDLYSDNYDNKIKDYLKNYPGFIDYEDNVVEAYFVSNIMASYQFSLEPTFENIKVFFKINNIFDNLYAAFANGKEFFPAAERNFLTGIQLGF